MIENKDFQELLKKYPGDAVMAIQIRFAGTRQLLYDLKVEGIKFPVGNDELKVITIECEDLNEEYEVLMDGADFHEAVYSER